MDDTLEYPQSSFIKAFVEAQKEMKPASKDATNPFFKTKYADLAAIDDACRSALNKHGIAIVQPIDFIEGIDFIHTQLLHVSGERLESRIRLINPKGDAQGFGSAVTYMRRYALAAICGVVTEDDDGEQAMHRNGKADAENGKADAEPSASVTSSSSPSAKSENANRKTDASARSGFISPAQVKRFNAIRFNHHWTEPQTNQLLQFYGASQASTISWKNDEYKKICDDLELGYERWLAQSSRADEKSPPPLNDDEIPF